ncbi:hypothetical protein [Streptomyces sp. 769]|uniref:hypothetical protein n=1 Tax=Streptomyces sp. 769 TaxID=1262452 RepID=UPI00057EFB17|nr:hypothetical protein [Streptomyces sp. 769]AJC60728.1 hypothetical protein GZL_08188 [Streptomyces sp. 769]
MNLRTTRTRAVLALAAAVCAAALCGAPAATAAPLPAPHALSVPVADPKPPCDENDKECQEENKRDQEGQQVDSGREQVSKDSEAAKQDISKAKDQVAECKPESKECMGKLAGDGAEQKEGMADTQKKLDAFHPEAQNDAGAAVGSTCDNFASMLPGATVDRHDGEESLADMCESMAK